MVQTILNVLQGGVPAATWRRERAALLDEDWALKANLRMGFGNLSHEFYVKSRNPFH